MMSLLENAAFLIFLMAIGFVIYRSVRYDDKVNPGKSKKFDIRPARRRRAGRDDTSEGPAA
ncbi:MAG: hypothetical protein D6763_08730 [Alphaproteobacteria bacterium]|nr:MAG: hypothetical protein D6763_08730 [Alphaproteobacteria bacterium]